MKLDRRGGQCLVARELESGRARDAEEDVTIAGGRTPTSDLHSVDRVGVDLDLESVDRALADPEASVQLDKRVAEKRQVLPIPLRTDICVLGCP